MVSYCGGLSSPRILNSTPATIRSSLVIPVIMTTGSCATIELAPIEPQARYPPLRHDVQAEERPSFGSSRRTLAQNGIFESGQSQNVVEVTQKWNNPKINVFRVAACSWGFLVMGANDVVYGVRSPNIIYSRHSLMKNTTNRHSSLMYCPYPHRHLHHLANHIPRLKKTTASIMLSCPSSSSPGSRATSPRQLSTTTFTRS